MIALTEADVEKAALEWLQTTGWNVAYGSVSHCEEKATNIFLTFL